MPRSRPWPTDYMGKVHLPQTPRQSSPGRPYAIHSQLRPTPSPQRVRASSVTISEQDILRDEKWGVLQGTSSPQWAWLGQHDAAHDSAATDGTALALAGAEPRGAGGAAAHRSAARHPCRQTMAAGNHEQATWAPQAALTEPVFDLLSDDAEHAYCGTHSSPGY